MLYINSPELTHLMNENLCLFLTISSMPPPTLNPQQPLFYSLFYDLHEQKPMYFFNNKISIFK